MTDPIGARPLRHSLGRREFMALAVGLLAGPLAGGCAQPSMLLA